MKSLFLCLLMMSILTTAYYGPATPLRRLLLSR
jgi:hypothetical protein